ncbi:hypothetical protein AAZX31_04G087500 [Glycine max]|uniref:Uncharacterized protein n=1 Tax=Glycine max TaxID=3847 RepID=A0A0R0K648_SOYBN|nr:hypothetical protein JHK87_009348 [Glycine soja]KAG5048637.1 hypothetical protein JHK85_009740 [Glycine max]KAG5065751.1 hypothetical protein JHK86_009482 [Glycine max]KAH1110537.1 hypothetical protein GYH30_009397 [Glycine max]KRH62160.1 hypothetical protein GLYMA_04G090200v4 [Glycine max]
MNQVNDSNLLFPTPPLHLEKKWTSTWQNSSLTGYLDVFLRQFFLSLYFYTRKNYLLLNVFNFFTV